MRILFVNPYYKPYLGGIERIIEHLSAEFVNRPQVEAVGIITTRAYFPDRWMTELPAREVIDGVQVFRCTFWPSRLPRVFHAALAGYLSADLPRVLRTFQPDIVHFTYGEWWAANLEAYLLSPNAVHIFSPVYHDVPHTRGTLPLYTANRWLARRVNAVHVLSDVERQQVCEAYDAPVDRTIVIPPGVELPDHIPQRNGGETVTVLAVARLNAHKGQQRLVEMIARLRQDSELPPLRLVLAGDDAGDRANIAIRVGELGLDSIVEITGRCSDAELQHLYSQADIFALPTAYESFGLVFLEAMAHGVPVVTYGVGPVPSVLTRGALLAPRGDERAFESALRTLVTDRSERLRLGADARELAMGFRWAATADQYLCLYAGALEQRGRWTPRT